LSMFNLLHLITAHPLGGCPMGDDYLQGAVYPFGRVFAGLVAEAQTDPEFAKLYLEHFIHPRRNATRVLLVRAIGRGEIAADTDLEVALDLLYGPVYHRLLTRHAPLTDRFIHQLVDAVIKALSP